MSEYKQNPVSAAVWPWTEQAQAAAKPAGPGKTGAFVGLFIGWGIAGLLKWNGHDTAFYVIATIASIIFICTLFIPPAGKAIHAFLQRFAFGVGKVLTYVTLVPFFYLTFPIGRLFFSLAGKDPMNRKFQPDRESYWDSRPAIDDIEQYKRQH